MDHRAIPRAGADRCLGRQPERRRLVVAWRRAPRRKRSRAAGGFKAAEFPFSSGCGYAQWAILGAFLGAAGDPHGVFYLLVPLHDIEIVDDWQVIGLAGHRQQIAGAARCVRARASLRDDDDLCPATPPGAANIRTTRWCVRRAVSSFPIRCRRWRSRPAAGRSTLVCRDLSTRISRRVNKMADLGVRAGNARRGCRGDRQRHAAAASGARLQHEHAGEFRPRPAPRPRRCGRGATWSTRSHPVGWAMERLCELSGARWVYDSDPLQEMRRDVVASAHRASRGEPPGGLCALWSRYQPAAEAIDFGVAW